MTEQPTTERVKVFFELPDDGDDWPLASTESLWAIRLPERDHVRLDNVPWFARNVADSDVFRVRADDAGTLWAVDKVSWSGNCTIRLIVYRDGSACRRPATGAGHVRPAGCRRRGDRPVRDGGAQRSTGG